MKLSVIISSAVDSGKQGSTRSTMIFETKKKTGIVHNFTKGDYYPLGGFQFLSAPCMC